jgi:predicted pyridoxine 5'-phosphate oxidase superfamily flavin-nucleotide-binding protein
MSMKISEFCRDILEKAEGKALATYSEKTGIHVVPVSSLRLDGNEIILVNYFFDKTLNNIELNSEVSLAAWAGLKGCQIKCHARSEIAGERFDSIVAWVAETIPGRVVKGILILSPKQQFDVSAGPEAGREIVE